MDTQGPKTTREMPDPSSLTTQQLWREIAALKELFNVEIESIKTSIKVAHDDLVRVPTEVQKQVGSLKELLEQRFRDEAALRDEKFASVQKQFDSGKTAVDAALAAVKEAGNKSEAGFTKLIDQLTVLFQTGIKGIEGQIDDLKDRFNRGEGRGEGQVTGRVSQQQLITWVLGLIVAAIVIFGFLMRGG
jgi:hypothetical protein